MGTSAQRWSGLHHIDEEQVEAWGHFLQEKWSWDWWLTLTFREEVGHLKANRLWRGWLKDLSRDRQCTVCQRSGRYARCDRKEGVAFELCRYRPENTVEFVRFTEMQRYRGERGVPHYHALMQGVGDARRLHWMDEWKALAGFAKIQPYDSSLGAGFYCTKYISKGGEVLFSKGL